MEIKAYTADNLKFIGSPTDFDREKVIKWYNTRIEQVDRIDLAIEDYYIVVVVKEDLVEALYKYVAQIIKEEWKII